MNSAKLTKFVDSLRVFVESTSKQDIRLGANGGNSILVAVPPAEELSYINEIKKQFSNDFYEIIDLNQLLVRFYSDQKHVLDEKFEFLASSPEQIFKSPEGEVSEDYFSMIIEQIDSSFKAGKAPVLINTGALYGTGIDNIHIMEHKVVMNAHLPLYVIYPSIKKNGKLLYLGIRVASKYRCLVMEA